MNEHQEQAGHQLSQKPLDQALEERPMTNEGTSWLEAFERTNRCGAVSYFKLEARGIKRATTEITGEHEAIVTVNGQAFTCPSPQQAEAAFRYFGIESKRFWFISPWPECLVFVSSR